jgi:hypothetical protein
MTIFAKLPYRLPFTTAITAYRPLHTAGKRYFYAPLKMAFLQKISPDFGIFEGSCVFLGIIAGPIVNFLSSRFRE